MLTLLSIIFFSLWCSCFRAVCGACLAKPLWPCDVMATVGWFAPWKIDLEEQAEQRTFKGIVHYFTMSILNEQVINTHHITIIQCCSFLPNSRFDKLPSPAIDWKIWMALYSRDCFVVRVSWSRQFWCYSGLWRCSSYLLVGLSVGRSVGRSVGWYWQFLYWTELDWTLLAPWLTFLTPWYPFLTPW